MSVVTVQLGQCGNQIGTQLFSKLYQESVYQSLPTHCRQAAIDRFFYQLSRQGSSEEPQCQARAVLVDMESKVVHNSLADAARSGRFTFDEKSVYAEKKGSGNNWAYGYLRQGQLCIETILEMIRRQVERCDHLDSFLVLLSVAGGTGSGVGARVTEALRDRYPNNALLNIAVWPYSSGEVIVQDYNSLLTMSHLQSSSDGIIVFQNEQLHTICSKLLHMKKITLADINVIAAHTLASILLPAQLLPESSCDVTAPGGNRTRPTLPNPDTVMRDDRLLYSSCRPSNIVTSVCPHPLYKLLSVKSIPHILDSTLPYSNYIWSILLKDLRQMMLTDSPVDTGMDWTVDPVGTRGHCRLPCRTNKSLANLLVLRGNELDKSDPSLFSDSLLYSNSVPSACTCSVWCCHGSFSKYEKSCTVVSNSQSSVSPLDQVCGRAWNMFSSRAYIHQYSKFGLTQEDFMSSFVAIEQVIKDYKDLSS